MTILLPELDYWRLDRELDRTKSQVFLHESSSAFLGPLMSSMSFSWALDIETACTNGLSVWWNPYFYQRLPIETRGTVLLHELWHPALLHMLRRGNRHPKLWNYAADITINNMLDYEKRSFEGLGFKPWLDHSYDGWVTEAIYDDLEKKDLEELDELARQSQWINPISGLGDSTDIIETDDPDLQQSQQYTIINNVVSAAHSATLSGGKVPGETEVTLKKFLSPKLPWDRLLHDFFNELDHQDYSWARPNRRYNEMYLPAMIDDRQGLDHVMYFEDVSGSISDGDSIRFNSEFKFVKDSFQPEKMTMVQFDTIIQKVDVFMKEDRFDEVKIVGRGGTSLVCVRDYIIEHKPTAVVIFSDLYCTPMEPLPSDLNIPIIWVCLNHSDAKVNQGQLVHLRE